MRESPDFIEDVMRSMREMEANGQPLDEKQKAVRRLALKMQVRAKY